MGLESMLENMHPKKRKLFENLFAVGFIFTIAYAFITLGWMGGDVMKFLQSGEFITVAILLIFTYFGYTIIKKGKINFNLPESKKPQPHNNPPPKRIQTVPKRKTIKPHLSISKEPKPYSYGSMQCPHCGSLMIGDQCKHCGFRR